MPNDHLIRDDILAELTNVTANDIDIDYFAFTVQTDHHRTEGHMSSLVGKSVILATDKIRHWTRENWDYVILRYYPIIVTTKRFDNVKNLLCQTLSNEGYVTLPSPPDTKYLVRGH